MFTDQTQLEREKKMQHAMLDIKKKYGKNAVMKANNLQNKATAIERNGQIGGHRAQLMGKYDDIINMKWPVPSKRPRMDMESRAKIFLPFSALKGLGNAIDEQNKTKDNMREYEYFDEENKGEEFYE